MSATFQVTVWCDGEHCGDWTQGSCDVSRTASVSGVRKFRRELSRKGWSRRHRDGRVLDLCPSCTKVERVGAGAQELPFGGIDGDAGR